MLVGLPMVEGSPLYWGPLWSERRCGRIHSQCRQFLNNWVSSSDSEDLNADWRIYYFDNRPPIWNMSRCLCSLCLSVYLLSRNPELVNLVSWISITTNTWRQRYRRTGICRHETYLLQPLTVKAVFSGLGGGARGGGVRSSLWGPMCRDASLHVHRQRKPSPKKQKPDKYLTHRRCWWAMWCAIISFFFTQFRFTGPHQADLDW